MIRKLSAIVLGLFLVLLAGCSIKNETNWYMQEDDGTDQPVTEEMQP